MPKPDPNSGQPGRFAYAGLDRVIHEKARLSVLEQVVRDAASAAKAGAPPAGFRRLKPA